MTTKQIEVFLTVARCGSFTLAADNLFMSQPTISRQIALLEEELGFDLFVRGNNYLKVTPQGEIMEKAFQKTQHILNKEIQMARSVSEGHIGSLTVGFISDMNTPDFLMEAMYQFERQYPGVSVRYVCRPYTDTFYGDLQNHIIDVMFTLEMEMIKFRDLYYEYMMSTHMGIYYGARHPLAGKPDLSIVDMKDEIDWTFRFADTPERRDQVKRVTDFYHMPEFPVKLLDSTNDIMYRLRMGQGVSIMDDIILKDLPQDMRILHVDPRVSTVNFSAFWERENSNPCIPLFLPILKKSVQSYKKRSQFPEKNRI